MKVTKPTLELIASILSSSQPAPPPHNPPEQHHYWRGRRQQFKRTVERFIEVLSQHNPNFKDDTFREAAYKGWVPDLTPDYLPPDNPVVGEHDEESE